MKIICTKEEQEALMFALMRSTECAIVLNGKEDCPGHLNNISCAECVLNKVEWVLHDYCKNCNSFDNEEFQDGRHFCTRYGCVVSPDFHCNKWEAYNDN